MTDVKKKKKKKTLRLGRQPVEGGAGGWDGGGTLNFVFFIGWAPASSVYPQNIYGISVITNKYPVYQPYPKKNNCKY